MKQKSSSLFAIGILALAISTSAVYANTATTNMLTYKSDKVAQPAKKVIITGNVEVILVQDADSKKLYSNQGATKARVYETDDVIYVSAKKNQETAKIILYVDNISRIDVSDNAAVSTKNILNLQYLQIILKDNATANISSKTESLYTKLANESSLKLNGNTESLSISTNELAVVDTHNFVAKKTEIEKRNLPSYAKAN